MNNKMNGLYITALILFLVSVVIMISNITVSVILQDRMISTILGISGVLIAMLGIIFATASKPKKIKGRTFSMGAIALLLVGCVLLSFGAGFGGAYLSMYLN